MHIRHGFADPDRPLAAHLYWSAFKGKLGRIMGPDAKALHFLTTQMDPTHALAAYDGSTLLGIAGFKTAHGALIGGGLRALATSYGWPGALWRAGLLALLDRDTDNDRFLMDGLFVSPNARGRGVGTALLNAITVEARTRGYAAVRLDVIDTNPRARALYERQGFAAVETQSVGLLAPLFGFKSATLMTRPTDTNA